MRVLAASVPASGHLNPMLPLIRTLVAGGDEVVVASGVDPEGAAAGAGALFRAAGRQEMDWFASLQARTRGAPGDGLRPDRINPYFVPRLFGEVAADDMIDDILSIGRELRPDMVLFETYVLAAPLAADLLGVPAVHHLISPMLDDEVVELTDDSVCPLWRSFGRDSPGYAGLYRDLTIGITPPALESHRVPSGEYVTMRPAPLPLRAPDPTTPPLIYVTLGTIFGANTDVFRVVLDALANEPVEVLVTVGSAQDPASLDPVPGNARVERFIPQSEVLPRCSVVIHHGGSGTMYGGLAHGLPQVVIPQGADNFLNGDLLARAGVGVCLPPQDLTWQSVRVAIRRVLEEGSYARTGRRLAAEVAAMAEPEAVAAELRRRFG